MFCTEKEALLLVVSVLLRPIVQLLVSTHTQEYETLLSQHQLFFLHICSYFYGLQSLTTAFGVLIEIVMTFFWKFFVEPGFTRSVGFVVWYCIIISFYRFKRKWLSFQSLKMRFDSRNLLDIKQLFCKALRFLGMRSRMSLQKTWFQQSCPCFAQRALMLVVSALLRPIVQLLGRTHRQEYETLLSQHQSFLHVCSSFYGLQSMTTAFAVLIENLLTIFF